MEGTSSDLTVIGFPPVEAGYLENTTFTQDKWNEKLNISSLTVDYKTRFGVFTATTNYFSRDFLFRHDQTDVTASNPFFANFFPEPFQATLPIDRDIWSSEIRFASQLEDSPIQFVVGVFHNRDDTNWKIQTMNVDENGVAFPFTPGFDDDVGSGGNTVYGSYRNIDIREIAVFGEATYSFNDTFELLLGGRWFESDFDMDEALTHPFFFTDVEPFVVDSVKSTADDVTWKVTFSWIPSDELRLFATRSTGSRRGGLNPAGLPFEEFSIPPGFGPDELVNYEIGVKSRLLDDRLSLNVTGYYMQWNDIQLEGTDAVGVFNFIGNFGEAEVKGVEFESTLLLADRLRISAAWSYQDAELTEDTPDLGANIPRGRKGDTIPNVPDFQGNMSIQYDQPMWGNWLGQVRFDVIYRGSTQTEFNDTIARNTKLDSYTILNANFSLIEADSGWRVNLFAKNLTDKLARVDAFGGDNRELAFVTVRPRTIGINVSKRF
jgi:outer membrane receptor protein involved in Fe transport